MKKLSDMEKLENLIFASSLPTGLTNTEVRKALEADGIDVDAACKMARERLAPVIAIAKNSKHKGAR